MKIHIISSIDVDLKSLPIQEQVETTQGDFIPIKKLTFYQLVRWINELEESMVEHCKEKKLSLNMVVKGRKKIPII